MEPVGILKGLEEECPHPMATMAATRKTSTFSRHAAYFLARESPLELALEFLK